MQPKTKESYVKSFNRWNEVYQRYSHEIDQKYERLEMFVREIGDLILK